MSAEVGQQKRSNRRNSSAISLAILLVAYHGNSGATTSPDNAVSISAISVAELEDKVRGGWAGQMIGVSFGSSTEFQFNGRLIPEDQLPAWSPEMVRIALGQDDLYVDVTFAAVIDQFGLDAEASRFAIALRDSEFSLNHANLAARRALRRGVSHTLSGSLRHNIHAHDIDFQIESDFIGLMSPGLPVRSTALAERIGRIATGGNGLYGGMFISAMYSAAFVEVDPVVVVNAGLAVLPAGSLYAKVIADVLSLHRRFPDDWEFAWQELTVKWDDKDMCPAGALHPFNIDAKLNGAYVALGLLYGGSDFEKTMHIATRSGQDSDCNPSNALGILGVMLGYSNIPEQYTAGIPGLANRKFRHTNYSFDDIVSSTLTHALASIEASGGSVQDGMIVIRREEAVEAILETHDDIGTPRARIPFDDERWRWTGAWRQELTTFRRNQQEGMTSGKPDAEASITFAGTGVAVTGLLLPNGGMADIYVDGSKMDTVDVASDEWKIKFGEAIWHRFGMENGQHELRIVVLGQPFEDSGGTDVTISGLIVYE